MSFRSCITFVLVLIATATVTHAADPAAGKQVEMSFTAADGTTTLKYLLYLPADFDKEPKTKWPVVMFLHGAGERGDDVQKVAVHGPPMLAKKDKWEHQAIIISPLCPKDKWWTQHTQALFELIVKTVKEQRGEPKQIYLTGLSMGGYGTWQLAFEHPELFAAIAPICGGFSGEPKALAQKLKNTPTWAFHGGADTVVKPDNTRRLVAALEAVKAPVKYTEYAKVGHNSWTRAYNDEKFWEWLFAQKLARNP